MPKAFMLSTTDNPFSPFTQFDEWFHYDTEKGYHCCSRLAQNSFVSDELSEEMQVNEINRAIDEIVQNDPLGIFIRVEEPAESK